MNYDNEITKAIMSIGSIRNDQYFILADLFDFQEWQNFNKGDRMNLGRVFKNRVINQLIPGVTYEGKANNGTACYMKRD